jgi:bifunctional non-homologous end joining protein LigD
VEIWDKGTYETEKWRDKEVIVRLHGKRIQGRYALIKTGDKNWLAHLMSDEPRPIVPDSLSDPRPMLATDELVEELTDDKWAFEGKWDGYRILLRYIDGKLQLTSRSGIDMTKDFPQLHTITDDLGLLDVVLDGEVVAFDEKGRTNFTRLAGRSAATEDLDIKFLLFDILYLNGSSLLRLKWEDRRKLLEEVAQAFSSDARVQLPPLLDGPGSNAVALSRERGWEGVVAKRRDSVYQQGRRSKTWRKQKNWTDIEVVIGGWRPGKGGSQPAHRFTADGPARGDRSAIRRPGGHGLHRQPARVADGRARTLAAQDLPVHRQPRPARRVRCGVGVAKTRCRCEIHGLDQHRSSASPILARHPARQTARGPVKE